MKVKRVEQYGKRAEGEWMEGRKVGGEESRKRGSGWGIYVQKLEEETVAYWRIGQWDN